MDTARPEIALLTLMGVGAWAADLSWTAQFLSWFVIGLWFLFGPRAGHDPRLVAMVAAAGVVLHSSALLHVAYAAFAFLFCRTLRPPPPTFSARPVARRHSQ